LTLDLEIILWWRQGSVGKAIEVAGALVRQLVRPAAAIISLLVAVCVGGEVGVTGPLAWTSSPYSNAVFGRRHPRGYPRLQPHETVTASASHDAEGGNRFNRDQR
jgi:hypothetical protein